MKAQKMFEKLGYTYIEEDEDIIKYSCTYLFEYAREEFLEISFLKKEKEIKMYSSYVDEEWKLDLNGLTKELLKAINKQCKELGWL